MTDARYPLGPMPQRLALTPQERSEAVQAIRALPAELRALVEGQPDTLLETPYREGGWTVRQVVHHLADSHLNALVRLKLALTEDNPTVKPYEEGDWAELPDTRLPLEPSLSLLDGLHTRWAALLDALTPGQWAREWTHPAQGQTFTVDTLAAMYAWHGRHHLAHIRQVTG
ncbi:putative metal-dependent hydrolase [Deinococcus metallilatus]|nr:putative metal-dependent hydrolase [Deinococcus metallilatus]QBY09599.1 putative metal-dependent hydrolase [Deinococcus metallilatus]RXJ09203.1 putative metal-dependent hydrolase [Deinococcus metallilatus]TLK22753.1 putative metal-dependent hydrolase [Deinococcus metallilatus]GMA13900.1 putative metal-dependent hydrolase [Deinococcus metallilatus]